uniref:Uncharacterized protein n=1 Tax=Candidatus Kentrum sp. SD TaxID=2126332 RepID=A0A451BJF3_9GAMM|nr:MAG: hypothetical protein BECKSD772D_GA0070982_101514 [Candidatus Kentron sp. SD]
MGFASIFECQLPHWLIVFGISFDPAYQAIRLRYCWNADRFQHIVPFLVSLLQVSFDWYVIDGLSWPEEADWMIINCSEGIAWMKLILRSLHRAL